MNHCRACLSSGYRQTAVVVSVLALIALATVAHSDVEPGPQLSARMSLEIDQLPISKALGMIASRYGLNMVVSGGDEVAVSLHLKDVTIQDALDAILYPNGFGYTITGNVLVVSSSKNQGMSGLTALAYRLKYITPEVAKKAVTPFLSANGRVEILGPDATPTNESTFRPTTILVRDYPTIIGQVTTTLRQIDIAERMIMIEVRMIESAVNAEDIIGLSWPGSATARLQDDSRATSTSASATPTAQKAGFIDLPNGQWSWGTLNVAELSATLDFLSASGNSKLVSHPKLATRENNSATFKVATIIPVQTLNRFNEGPSTADIVSFQDIEIGVTLNVMPRINEGDIITMDVHPVIQEITGFVGTANQQKPITSSREVRTTVTCKDGETVVIGGLLKESNINDKEKVFLLGSIPGLGELFTHRRKSKENTDLVIMITPTIMK